MTKFISLPGQKSTVRPTVFTRCVNDHYQAKDVEDVSPDDFETVIHIGYDSVYGDVFKAVRRGESAEFVIYFGKRGDEYYEPIQ